MGCSEEAEGELGHYAGVFTKSRGLWGQSPPGPGWVTSKYMIVGYSRANLGDRRTDANRKVFYVLPTTTTRLGLLLTGHDADGLSIADVRGLVA